MKHTDTPTFYFVSLGCPKNRVDTEVAVAALMDAGYVPVDSPDGADVLLVNTCSFITAAKEESIDTLLELAAYKENRPGARLVAMGCMGQEAADDLAQAMPEIDLVLGTGVPDRLPELLASGPRIIHEAPVYLPDHAAPRVLTQTPYSAYLKIADGCSRSCAFCTIPSIKGPYLSRPVPALLDEARALADQGVKELVLVAQDLTWYGRPERKSLHILLDGLERVEGLEWVRLLYLYPEGLGDWLLKRIGAGGKVLPYLDIPIQHSSNQVLRRMRRATTNARICRLIERARHFIPDVTLRTTVIVGHPGEDDKAFDELLEFIRDNQFDNLGAFMFSAEAGTVSAGYPDQIPAPVARRRLKRVMKVQKGIVTRKNRQLIGSVQKVLVHGPCDDHDWVFVGRTAGQAPEIDGVTVLDGYDNELGPFLDVTITRAMGYDLVGEPLPVSLID